ncbi:hypothetical protein F5B17DRAFT_408401 [Nemania serpens]|nr:hypothetical protein F5B17DRAFT_408401 [Nemania serpens]
MYELPRLDHYREVNDDHVSHDMTVKSDLIASLVQREFDRLPSKRKPVLRDNGLREWVPLSGIVAEGTDPAYLPHSVE